jgi:uncharacterized surface protein with fasciclin (FAS1) repeats
MKKNRFVGRCATFFLTAGLFSAIVFSCKEDAEDKVKPKTITDIILQNDEFSILREIMQTANMSDGLRTTNYTLFAPDNKAFAKANIFSAKVITSKGEPAALAFLRSHIIEKSVLYDDFKAGDLKAINENKLTVEKKDSVVSINKSEIVMRNVYADNGIMQVIDSVLVNVK